MELSLDRRITTTLSLAVLLKDDFTGKEEIVGGVKVSIPGSSLNAIKNPSGYYNFLNLEPGAYSVSVKSDFYIDREISITIPPAEIVQTITLQPDHCYPFPLWATLLRGVVSDGTGNAISGAVVEWVSGSLTTTTSAKGEFVLYFPIEQEDAIGDVTVTPQGEPALTIDDVEIKKCQTTSLPVTY